jgi:hypothetical protein
MKLLKEYIEKTILLEKLQKKKGFKLEKLKEFETYEDAIDYANEYLELLGIGSSRATFFLNPRKVIKIAKNDKGVGQNQQEIQLSKEDSLEKFVTKVYEHADDNTWITAEVVRPIKESEFNTIIGINFDLFMDELDKTVYAIKNNHEFVDSENEFDEKIEDMMNELAQGIVSNDLLMADIRLIDHWGVTADRRLVVLDYGFTNDTKNHFYISSNTTGPKKQRDQQKDVEDDITIDEKQKEELSKKDSIDFLQKIRDIFINQYGKDKNKYQTFNDFSTLYKPIMQNIVSKDKKYDVKNLMNSNMDTLLKALQRDIVNDRKTSLSMSDYFSTFLLDVMK